MWGIRVYNASEDNKLAELAISQGQEVIVKAIVAVAKSGIWVAWASNAAQIDQLCYQRVLPPCGVVSGRLLRSNADPVQM